MATALSHADATRAVEAARAAAAEVPIAAAVAVVDANGDDLVVVRDPSASWFTASVARAKARTAARFGRPTADLAELAGGYPEVLAVAADELGWNPVTLDGGVPLRCDGLLVGAVAVSGGLPETDRRCADAAVAALEER